MQEATTTNRDRFVTVLTGQYKELFARPEYAGAAQHNTPAELAEKMTAALAAGSGDKTGAGVSRTCRALGIKTTYKAIAAYLSA